MQGRRRVVAVVTALAGAAGAWGALAGQAVAQTPSARTLAAAVSAGDIPFKGTVDVTGRLTDPAGAPVGGAPVILQASPWPYRAPPRTVATATTAADGTVAFAGLRPDRNTRYRIVETAGGGATGKWLEVIVEAPAVGHVYQLRYGMVMVTVLSYHSPAFNWGGRPAYWFVAAAGSRRFHLVTITHTHERRPGVTYMTATFPPPRGRFTYRVCFDAPGEQAVGKPGTNRGCPHSDFVVSRAA